ncbi:MAG: hypothetical protein WBO23_12830, partial [Burkholderiales bacterium]
MAKASTPAPAVGQSLKSRSRSRSSRSPRAPSATGAWQPSGPGNRTLASRLAKLGILRDFDLVLHLPLRYEDET